MGVLANKIADRVKRLDSLAFPENVVCSHFGEYLNHANLAINIGCRKVDVGTLLITVYDNRCKVDGYVRATAPEEDGRYWVGNFKWLHQARARSIAKALNANIINQWNGGDGMDGISLEFDRKCPAIVLQGIRNYRDLPNGPFKLSQQDEANFSAYRTAVAE